ncbi:MAG: DnaJ domain-containing protein, partial [Deltaproteobacteria bacterium]|nr:DnaJ domain-containing protein [Deltaproteobacteria bacterium]
RLAAEIELARLREEAERQEREKQAELAAEAELARLREEAERQEREKQAQLAAEAELARLREEAERQEREKQAQLSVESVPEWVSDTAVAGVTLEETILEPMTEVEGSAPIEITSEPTLDPVTEFLATQLDLPESGVDADSIPEPTSDSVAQFLAAESEYDEGRAPLEIASGPQAELSVAEFLTGERALVEPSTQSESVPELTLEPVAEYLLAETDAQAVELLPDSTPEPPAEIPITEILLAETDAQAMELPPDSTPEPPAEIPATEILLAETDAQAVELPPDSTPEPPAEIPATEILLAETDAQAVEIPPDSTPEPPAEIPVTEILLAETDAQAMELPPDSTPEPPAEIPVTEILLAETDAQVEFFPESLEPVPEISVDDSVLDAPALSAPEGVTAHAPEPVAQTLAEVVPEPSSLAELAENVEVSFEDESTEEVSFDAALEEPPPAPSALQASAEVILVEDVSAPPTELETERDLLHAKRMEAEQHRQARHQQARERAHELASSMAPTQSAESLPAEQPTEPMAEVAISAQPSEWSTAAPIATASGLDAASIKERPSNLVEDAWATLGEGTSPADPPFAADPGDAAAENALIQETAPGVESEVASSPGATTDPFWAASIAAESPPTVPVDSLFDDPAPSTPPGSTPLQFDELEFEPPSSPVVEELLQAAPEELPTASTRSEPSQDPTRFLSLAEQITESVDLPSVSPEDLSRSEMVGLTPRPFSVPLELRQLAVSVSAPEPEEPSPSQDPWLSEPAEPALTSRSAPAASSHPSPATAPAPVEAAVPPPPVNPLAVPLEVENEASWNAVMSPGPVVRPESVSAADGEEDLNEKDDAARARRQRLLRRAFGNLGAFSSSDADETPPDPVVPPAAASPASATASTPAAAMALSPDELTLAKKIEAKVLAIKEGHDHFALLGVARTSTREQIKTAYIQLVKTFHPDHVPVSLAHLAPKVSELFNAIRDAHDVLQDDARRSSYLEELARPKNDLSSRASNDAEIAERHAELHLRKKEFVQASQQFARAFAITRNPSLLAQEAWAIYLDPTRKAELPLVKKKLEEALKLDPKSDRACYSMGVICRVEGDLARAEKLFKTAVATNPRHAEASTELRLIEMRRKKG